MTESHRDYHIKAKAMKDHRIMEVTHAKLTEVGRHIRLLKKYNPDSEYAIENIDGMVWIVEDV